MTRAQWKVYYRQLRIIRRETWKATEDMILFGTGVVEVSENIPDYIRYVPLDMVLV